MNKERGIVIKQSLSIVLHITYIIIFTLIRYPAPTFIILTIVGYIEPFLKIAHWLVLYMLVYAIFHIIKQRK
ncbi:hypothetical protein DDN72_17690 [Vibrio cholerae]|nr:hypothetical protein [Vibrio cholerae]